MVRRALSTILLGIFLFNIVGYYGIYWLAHQRNNTAILHRINTDRYTLEETITIKLPLSLPYPVNGSEYERVNGSFQHEGEFFKLVKQKLEGDTLYVVCIKDHHEKKIFSTMADYTKASNDFPATSKTMKVLGSFVKDFEKTSAIEVNAPLLWHFDITYYSTASKLLDRYAKVLSPPPWHFC